VSEFSFDDLLGDSSQSSPSPIYVPTEEEFSTKTGRLHDVMAGVSIQWLSIAFGMSKPNIAKKLSRCPSVATHRNGAQIYDLKTAAAFLIPPKTDVRAYLRGLKPDDLPEQLKSEFWAARLKEQKWRAQAGELWPSDSVIHVLGEVFKTIKQTAQLWTDTVDETDALTDAQRDLLRKMIDDLLDSIHVSLKGVNAHSETQSQLAEIDDHVE
jgi:hypothetical protein